MIASDRTSGGEQRHGPVDGGSSASEEPEIKGRSTLAVARRAAAVIDPASAGHVGAAAATIVRSSAARPDSSPARRQFYRRSEVGGGVLDRRATGVGHQGGGDLRVPAWQRSRLAGSS